MYFAIQMKFLKFRRSKSFAAIEEEFREEVLREEALKKAQPIPEVKSRLGSSSSNE
jgi:hypothetical protein